MTTPKRREANRRNAKLSTGPVTPEGKAIAKMNALKYGLFAKEPVLPGEDAVAYIDFGKRLRGDFQPQTAREEFLADKFIDDAWRSRRFPVLEARILTNEMYRDAAANARETISQMAHYESISPAETSDPARCEELLQLESDALDAAAAPELALGRAYIRDCSGPAALAKLNRAEVTVNRNLFVNLRALERAQERSQERKGTKSATFQNEPIEGLNPEDLAA